MKHAIKNQLCLFRLKIAFWFYYIIKIQFQKKNEINYF